MMNYLLEQGADPNVLISQNSGFDPLLFTGWLTNNETAFNVYENLIKHGLNIYTFNSNSESILTMIINSGNQSVKYTEEAVNFFISKGADKNHANSNGDTPLHIATRHGYIRIVRLLLDTGAESNVKNNKFQTPLDIAKGIENDSLINLLKQYQ